LGKALQKTAAGQQQFEKLVAEGQETKVIFNNEKVDVDPNKPLNFKLANTDSEVEVSTDKDTGEKKGDVKSSVITLNMSEIKRIRNVADKLDKQGEALKPEYGIMPSGFSSDEYLGLVAGHEIEHTTDKNATTLLNKGKVAYENEAAEINQNITEQIKEQKKKK
jgi:hypothetical protein